MATTEPFEALDFFVARDDLNRCKFEKAVRTKDDDLESGQILVCIDSFGFTANNITYAVFGDAMGYWNFFPAPSGWGRIPVWGFADVAASRSDAVEIGERIFGYFPMSTHLILEPRGASAAAFVDGSAHRTSLHPVYNQYNRNAGDPAYDSRYEKLQMLFRPLFMTSFLLDDFLADNEFFGARSVILSSASSKTAYGLAFLLSSNRGAVTNGAAGLTGAPRRPERSGYEVIGLTSESHRSFVEGLGCYDRVASYDEIDSLSADVATAFVDMAGDGDVRGRLHRHFGDNMKYSCMVGATHWDRQGSIGPLPGAEPLMFFAPDQIKKREHDWGPGGVQQRFAGAWRSFLSAAAGWIQVVEGRGPEQVERVYRKMLAGRSKANQGYVLSLRPAA